jgi:hypothetical protein
MANSELELGHDIPFLTSLGNLAHVNLRHGTFSPGGKSTRIRETGRSVEELNAESMDL